MFLNLKSIEAQVSVNMTKIRQFGSLIRINIAIAFKAKCPYSHVEVQKLRKKRLK
jgi:hypothetical protein